MSVNDITGNRLRSKPPSDSFRENFDRIFGVAKSGPNHLGKQNDGITDCSKSGSDVCGDASEADSRYAGSSR